MIGGNRPRVMPVRIVGAAKDHGQIRVTLANLPQQFQAVEIDEPDIQDDRFRRKKVDSSYETETGIGCVYIMPVPGQFHRVEFPDVSMSSTNSILAMWLHLSLCHANPRERPDVRKSAG